MKSIWLFILMIGGVAQLRAQQLSTPQTGLRPDNSIYQYFKSKPGNSALMPNTPELIPTVPLAKNLATAHFTDKMPIAKLQSTDKMPIIKPDEPNMRYTMLIKPLGEAKPDSVIKATRP